MQSNNSLTLNLHNTNQNGGQIAGQQLLTDSDINKNPFDFSVFHTQYTQLYQDIGILKADISALKERNVLEITNTVKWIVGFIGFLITLLIALCTYLYSLHSDDIQTNTIDIKRLLEFSPENYEALHTNYKALNERLIILESSQTNTPTTFPKHR